MTAAYSSFTCGARVGGVSAHAQRELLARLRARRRGWRFKTTRALHASLLRRLHADAAAERRVRRAPRLLKAANPKQWQGSRSRCVALTLQHAVPLRAGGEAAPARRPARRRRAHAPGLVKLSPAADFAAEQLRRALQVHAMQLLQAAGRSRGRRHGDAAPSARRHSGGSTKKCPSYGKNDARAAPKRLSSLYLEAARGAVELGAPATPAPQCA